MNEFPQNEKKLANFVPETLLDLIRDRIKAGVVDAEALFDDGEEDEDTLTGALGAKIATPGKLVFREGDAIWSYEIRSKKIRGRGSNAPEKDLGADGIFQVSVSHGVEQVFSKGLPFQAKIRGGYNNVTVRGQARDLFRTSGTGVVVRYSENGYEAIDVRKLISGEGARARVGRGSAKKLTAVLGDDFLDCSVGRPGLFYDPEKEAWSDGVTAITTRIERFR
jgi:hypothetical protein